MNYYDNSDLLCDRQSIGRIGSLEQAVQGVDYSVVVDLVQEPVILEEFKQHARVDFNTDDNLIARYLKAAREYLEEWSQLSFGVKTIRFTALRVPDKYKLMNGPYTAISDPNRTLFGAKGDTLMQGGREIDVTLTTGWPAGLPETIKVAICRYAAGLYAVRENLIYSVNGVPHEPTQVMDEAQKMIRPWANITWP